uniref:Uncharacterized protein n=1 Tax=Anopheles dirus TaxID=7168 RepID=A0A182N6G7_9DIPT
MFDRDRSLDGRRPGVANAANGGVLSDAQSPGLVNRLVRYYDHSQNQTMNRSQSLSSVYNKPGQFPLVHLRKQEQLRYGGNSAASRRKGYFNMVRIAPPEKSLFPTNKRSSILRSSSMLLPTAVGSGEPSSVTLNGDQTTLFAGGRGLSTQQNGAGGDAGNDGGETDVENRVITPCAELEATPTRSVLDALKEISRKRINSEELDADRIKKQCQELSELDAAGSGPPSSTAAVAIGTHGLATKRSREQAAGSSPSSPPEHGLSIGLGGRAADERQAQKKRLCVKNNDILSSLSSSLVAMHTPKRFVGPRIERRFNSIPSVGLVSLSSTPAAGTMPCSSSTLLGPLTTPEKFSSMALNSPVPLERTREQISNVPNKERQPQQPQQQQQQQPQSHHQVHRGAPKITLFNRPYDNVTSAAPGMALSPKAHSSRVITSDGEEDELGEGSGKVQFVRPKEKSPHDVTLAGSGTGGFSSSRDPLKKPAPSKLTVMLKCLSGDLDDYEEEVVDEVTVVAKEPPKQQKLELPRPTLQTRTTGFTFGNDTVDATSPKEPSKSAPSKPPTIVSVVESTASSAPVSTPPAATPVTTNSLSALINNPIKDAGLGKITPSAGTKTTVQEVTPDSNPAPAKQPENITSKVDPKPADQPVAVKAPLPTFTFGTNSSIGSAAVVTPSSSANPSSGFSSPVKPPAASTTATFTFGTPVQQKSGTAMKAASPLAAGGLGASVNLMSFSPAAFGGGGGDGKINSPVIQFGGSTVASPPVALTTTQSSSSSSSTPTFSFSGASTTTAAGAATLPGFSAGTTFGAFKLPLTQPTTVAPVGITSSSSTATSSVTLTTTSTAVTPAAAAPMFSFGTSASNKPTTTPAGIPMFGAGSGLTTPAANTATTSAVTSPSSTFIFGSVSSAAASAPAPTGTLKAPTSASLFPFGGANQASATSAPPAAPTTTFPTFGSSASANPSSAAAPGATQPTQPFTFGSANKPAATPATTGNLFAAAAADTTTSATSGTTTNLFAAAGTTPAPQQTNNSNTNVAMFGQATTGTSMFGAATTAGTTSSPFTFGAAKASPQPAAATNGPAAGGTTATSGSIFGNAVAAPAVVAPSSTTAAAAPSTGMFTFGASQNTTGAAATAGATPIVPSFGNVATNAGSTTTGSSATASSTPFTFGAVANKAPAANAAPGASGGIFGSALAATNGGSNTGGNTFGATMNGGTTMPAFGGGSIFGPQTNGPQNAGNTAGNVVAVASSSGGMFTFGASANNATNSNNNNAPTGGTFGTPAGGFGGFSAGGLTNGTASNTSAVKPFTFGAVNANTQQNNQTAGQQHQQQQQQQQQQQVPGVAPSGGFNFNLGSNAPAPAAKPFTFAASTNGGGSIVAPPMFGSPVASNTAAPPNASPFTFMANNNNNNNNSGVGNQAAPNAATPGPFTFGAAAAPSPGAFNFSAGNVAAVAPQPQQQQQQQQPAFNFGGGQQQQQQSPFGGGGGGIAAPAFGAPPSFGSPAGVMPVPGGVMPTFSIGTNSTPNGPTMGQRRIKVATRRVK